MNKVSLKKEVKEKYALYTGYSRYDFNVINSPLVKACSIMDWLPPA